MRWATAARYFLYKKVHLPLDPLLVDPKWSNIGIRADLVGRSRREKFDSITNQKKSVRGKEEIKLDL